MLVEICRVNKEVVDLSELISGLEALKKKSPDLGGAHTRFNQSKTEVKPKTESELEKHLKELFDAEEFKME
jgi:hypothetical protein